jgi:hypothetical protein
MSVKLQELTVVGSPPNGTDLFRVTSNGIYDVVNNRYFNPYHIINRDLLAASVDSFIWGVIEGQWQVAGVMESHTVVGSTSAAVTVLVCPQAVAIASGVAQLSAGFDLTVTAPAKAFGTLIASPTVMTKGDVLALDFSGTLTNLVGNITIWMKRVG